ncbi:MAG: glycoside hydrolase family 5 protein [Ktedonobacteraceae bacterium]
MITKRKALQFLLLLLVVMIATTFFFEQRRSSTASTTVFPHVVGTQLIDSSGKPLILQGAQIETGFAYANPWKDPTNLEKSLSSMLNSTVFNEMSQNWHMNALRLPLSNWVYAAHQQLFLQLLDKAIQEANQAGLYVILDLHDYQQGGSPYGNGASMPKPESVTFWKAMATHYLNNTMVLFDEYNEPHYPSANQWLNGGGTQKGSTGKTAPIIGLQTLVKAIRSTGAKQIIIIGGIHDAGTLRISDPNIVYTTHTYHKVAIGSPAIWNQQWAGFIGHYPLFYGEWALLPNATTYHRCQTATMQNANQKVQAFLNYMQQNQISWTAWQFNPPYLILNRSSFTPTKLNDPNHPWKCNSPNALAGMGAVIQQFLLSSSNQSSSLSSQHSLQSKKQSSPSNTTLLQFPWH